MSGASERANGRASGPVLQSVFLAVIDHSASPFPFPVFDGRVVPVFGDIDALLFHGSGFRGHEREQDFSLRHRRLLEAQVES